VPAGFRPDQCARRQIHYPRQRISRLRQEVAAKYVVRLEFGPELRQLPCDGCEIIAAGGKGGTIDRSGGTAPYHRERVATFLSRGQYPMTFVSTSGPLAEEFAQLIARKKRHRIARIGTNPGCGTPGADGSLAGHQCKFLEVDGSDYVLLSIANVTGWKNLAVSLARVMEAAEQADRAKSEFPANMRAPGWGWRFPCSWWR
jgi:hypothetical protein